MRGTFSIPPTRGEIGLTAIIEAKDATITGLIGRIRELEFIAGRERLRAEEFREDAEAWRARLKQARDRHHRKKIKA